MTMTEPDNTPLHQAVSMLQRYNESNILQIRLDTKELLAQIEVFLRGQVLDYETEKLKDIGVPKMNDMGIQSVLNKVASILNPAVVQGYFPEEKNGESPEYLEYINGVEYHLLDELMINKGRYNLNIKDLKPLLDFVMDCVRPYMTRLIGNKERDSYGQSMKMSQETMPKSSGLFPLMRGKQK